MMVHLPGKTVTSEIQKKAHSFSLVIDNKGYDIKKFFVKNSDHKAHAFSKSTVGLDLQSVENYGKLEGPCPSKEGDWRAQVPSKEATKGFMPTIKGSTPNYWRA